MIDPRKIITDAVALWLTGALLTEFVIWVTGNLGLTEFIFTEDTFVAHAPAFTFGLAAGAVVAALTAWALDRVRAPTVGRALFAVTPPGARAWIWHLGLIFGLIVVASLRVTEASWRELLDPNGLAGAARLWSGLVHPEFTILPKAVALTVQTVLIAFLATILGVPVAGALSFLAAQNLTSGPTLRAAYYVIRFGLNVARSVEPLIWALIFTVWVGVGPFAGMLALLVHSVASLIKYYSEIIEGVDQGPLDAVRATGARPVQVIWFAVLPQVVLPFIAMTIYRWDTNVRMATVIGLVGGGGIGTLLIQYQGQAMWPEVGCIVLVIAVIVWLLDLTSAQLREALK